MPLKLIKSPYFIEVLKNVHQLRQVNLIVCGDFNDIADATLDSTHRNRYRIRGIIFITTTHDLYDAW